MTTNVDSHKQRPESLKCEYCPDGGQIKFNGGNLLCIKCHNYVSGTPRVSVSVVVHDD
jgi:hypothetical protein